MVTIYSSHVMSESLRKSALFSHLTAADLITLTQFARRKYVKAKKMVFRRAAPGKHMCVIASGRVKLSTPCVEGRDIILGILESGDVFGEMSLLDGQHRSATVTTLEPTELVIIERCNFIPFLEQHPEVALKLMAMLSQRLRLMNECFENALLRQLPARLAKKLLHLAERYGVKASEGITINVKLSQRDIGNLVGRSRESINKQMRAWEGAGWISYKGGYITIFNMHALEALTDAFFCRTQNQSDHDQDSMMFTRIN